MEIKMVESKEMLKQAFLIRKKVFVEEQKVPLNEEIDEFENDSMHFLVFDAHGQAVATSRMRNIKQKIKIERVCVLPQYRYLQIGKQLMLFMETAALQRGYQLLCLNAQKQAVKFYEKLGYKICSALFLESGIEHYSMEKILNVK